MGRRNKSYSKDLHQQAYERLNSMQAFGESRRAAKVEGTDRDKIFSFNTYKSYWKHTKYFIKYIKEHYPECTTLKKARKYVGEWLQDSVDRGLSAWTIGVQRSAMGKLYGIAPDDEDFFKAPKKQRENIKRSRGVRVRDKHFSKTNNDGLIKFCQGTGLRRKELQELRGKDLVTRAQIEAEISQMSEQAAAMVEKAVDAFCASDVQRAQEVMEADNAVNELYVAVEDKLVGLIRDGKASAQYLPELLMVAKYFERMGDLAKRIAAWAIFRVTGEHVVAEKASQRQAAAAE